MSKKSEFVVTAETKTIDITVTKTDIKVNNELTASVTVRGDGKIAINTDFDQYRDQLKNISPESCINIGKALILLGEKAKTYERTTKAK